MTQLERSLPKNRTGIATSRDLAQEMVTGTSEFAPSSAGTEAEIAALRAEYAAEAEPPGSAPPPATMRGAVSTAMKAIKQEKPIAFLDLLGARLAFERSGTRLYEALISKLDVFGSFDGGPARAELERFRSQELQHFHMLASVITELGGDPTAVTPAANLEAVMSRGVLYVVVDARTSLVDSLHAMHNAELTDTDCWGMLVEAASLANRDDLVERFTAAMLEEQEHLDHVRRWLMASLRT